MGKIIAILQAIIVVINILIKLGILKPENADEVAKAAVESLFKDMA